MTAVLPVNTQPVTFGLLAELNRPPPNSAVLPVNTQSGMVGVEKEKWSNQNF